MKTGRKASPWLGVAAWGMILAIVGAARATVGGTSLPDVNWAEPNDAKAFSATWTSATLYATLNNPAEHQGMTDTGVARTLNVAAKIYIDPLAKVFGTTHGTADLNAVTETGAQLAVSGIDGPSHRSYSSFGVSNYQLTGLNFPMDPNRGYPLLLKEVRWTEYALLYRQERWADVPFQVTGQWVQVVPRMKVQFTEATSQAGVYQYKFTGQYEGPGNPFMSSPWVGEGSPLPWYVVTKVELLDAKGMPIRAYYSNLGQQSAGTVTCSGYGEYSTLGGVKTMRFWVITDPYEIKLPFVLTDIPVPTL